MGINAPLWSPTSSCGPEIDRWRTLQRSVRHLAQPGRHGGSGDQVESLHSVDGHDRRGCITIGHTSEHVGNTLATCARLEGVLVRRSGNVTLLGD